MEAEDKKKKPPTTNSSQAKNNKAISQILGHPGRERSQNWVKSSEWSDEILRINTGKHAENHYSNQPCSDCIYSDLHKGGIVLIVFDLISLLLMLTWQLFQV